MLFVALFLTRYYPFWAVPLALVLFEVGLYHYHRRERMPGVVAFLGAIFLTGSSVAWLLMEGYWRAGILVKDLFYY